MTQLDQQKIEIIEKVRSFCHHCVQGEIHVCPVTRLVEEIQSLRGIPIIVNDRLHHVMFL